MGANESRTQEENAEKKEKDKKSLENTEKNKKKRKWRENTLRMIDIKDKEQVEAYLVKSTLPNSVSISEQPDSGSSFISSVCHWALVFVFSNYVVTIDGLKEDGKLVPRYRRIPDRPFGQYFSLSNPETTKSAAYRTAGFLSMERQMPTLVNLTVSPDDLRLVALRTAGSSKYEMMTADCQTWAADAACSLVNLQQRRERDFPPSYKEATWTQKTKTNDRKVSFEDFLATYFGWTIFYFYIRLKLVMIPLILWSLLIFCLILSIITLVEFTLIQTEKYFISVLFDKIFSFSTLFLYSAYCNVISKCD
ncbi:hypothetical protein B566_EDAN007711 [Ephemera danica]|nr:hypothetical protein B566_EDAN007711 [Ephemera danica]